MWLVHRLCRTFPRGNLRSTSRISTGGEYKVFSRNHNFIAIAVLLIASAAGAQDITFTEIDKSIPFNGQTIVQGDINRDGYPDLLIGLGDSLNIYTYKSDGKGNYVDWT